ncbi:DUF1854 domain-containing protein [Paenibacillus sp. 1P07SE]|uniref:DUF1854 domain-containing protein n=1 Tax=Paenibacillus sp. 1P07SE TaxID=3132209 RepID=UPI0039A459EB
MSQLVYYRAECDTPSQVRLHRNSRGMLVLEMDGARYERIRLVRGLPRVMPESYISVLQHTGEQIALIHHLSLLDETSRSEAERELERGSLLPEIERIDSISCERDGWVWQVQTDCGAETIVLHATGEQLHRIAPTRWIIVNYNGHRCQLSDLTALDGGYSHRQVETWLRRYG